jgi:hypothetical protein
MRLAWIMTNVDLEATVRAIGSYVDKHATKLSWN